MKNGKTKLRTLVAGKDYIMVNRGLVASTSLKEMWLFSELCNECDYWEEIGQLQNGYFYSTIDNIQKRTGLTRSEQETALNKLVERGLIEIKLVGIPRKRYFRINIEKLAEEYLDMENGFGETSLQESYKLETPIPESAEQVCRKVANKYVENSQTSVRESRNTYSEKVAINKNNIIITNNNNNINNIKEYKESSFDTSVYEDIVNYLNIKTGAKYKYTTPKTQTLIKARLNQGFTVEDFKIVIDKKTLDWFNDKKMCEYLRPETLFGTKFESYLNKPNKSITTKDLVDSGTIDFSMFRDGGEL